MGAPLNFQFNARDRVRSDHDSHQNSMRSQPLYDTIRDTSGPTMTALVQGFWETKAGSEVSISGSKATWVKSGHTATIKELNPTTIEVYFDGRDTQSRETWQATLVLCENGSQNLTWTDGDCWKRLRAS